MLAGKKLLAMFNDDIPEGMEPPEVVFDPHAAEGRFVKREAILPVAAFKPAGPRYYLCALPGEEWRMERLIDLQRGFFEHRLPTTRALETEIGQLLGYDEFDIRALMNRWFAFQPNRSINLAE